MARGAKYDPLEAAKIGVEDDTPRVAPYVPPAQRATSVAVTEIEVDIEEPVPTPSSISAVVPTSIVVDGEEPEARPGPAPGSIPTATSSVPPRPRYRVVEAKRISVSGQFVKMLPGRIIDSAGYGGEAGIQRLRDQGLKLELV